MLMIAAKNLLRVPNSWDITPEGIGTMAYHQRHTGITLAQLLTMADTEDEVWRIADGWSEAQGCDNYTTEMLAEIENTPVRMAWERDDYIGE